jgi:hypothetical protein
MRTGSTRGRLWWLGALLLGGVVGCGADEQSVRIAQVNSTLTEVTAKLGEVKAAVKKAVDSSKDSGREIKPDDENLKVAIESAKEIRNQGLKLQRIKEYTDRLKDTTSPQTSKELLARFRGGLRENLLNLGKEEDALKAVLVEAEGRADGGGKVQLAKLKEELKHGVEAFDLLNKRR